MSWKLLAALLVAAPVCAQTPDPGGNERTTLGTTLEADLLEGLPTTDDLFAIVETIEPSLISDRFSAGGLSAGQPARIGGFPGAATQTLFRVGDIDLTDPTGSGAPLLFPDLRLWQRVSIATGMTAADVNAAGPTVTLEPRRPGARWEHVVYGSASHFGLTAHAPSTVAPAIVRLGGWDRVAVTSSGPLMADRLGAVFAASWTRGSEFRRAESSAVDARLSSAFVHLVFAPDGRHEVRTIGWLQRAEYPFAQRTPFNQPGALTDDRSAHLQASVERHASDSLQMRVYASYTRRARTSDFTTSQGPVFERLRDGPVSELSALGNGTVKAWSLGGRVTPRAATLAGLSHAFRAGLEMSGSEARNSSFFSGDAGELVDGVPARVWRFRSPGIESTRTGLTIVTHVSDRVALTPRLALDAGLRFESLSGSAEGAADTVRWRSWLPRAVMRWAIADAGRTAVFAGYARSAHRLALDLLAVGDPAAPTADVFRWEPSTRTAPSPNALGPLVARSGPGTGGDPGFSMLGANLKRPYADELVLGLDTWPGDRLRFRLVGIARHETNLLGLINTGAPASAYSSFAVSDPGANLGLPDDDRLVPVYNRLPASFGLDRYVLTNPDQESATFKGVETSLTFSSHRFTFLGGATAGIARSSAAHRGFGPTENDHSYVGELLTNPNAATFAHGRPFMDRGYTVKLAGVHRFPHDVRLGVIARYQDGQPFARMLVFPALNQGAEAVRAFANGDSRFRFTGTLDVRLQKGLAVGARRVDAILDAYNLLNFSYDVEERTTEGPDVRLPIAVQPPRAFHIGVRVTL